VCLVDQGRHGSLAEGKSNHIPVQAGERCGLQKSGALRLAGQPPGKAEPCVRYGMSPMSRAAHNELVKVRPSAWDETWDEIKRGTPRGMPKAGLEAIAPRVASAAISIAPI